MNDTPIGSDPTPDADAEATAINNTATNSPTPDGGAPVEPAVPETPAAAEPVSPPAYGPPVPLAPRTSAIIAGAGNLWKQVGVERALGAAVLGAIAYAAAWIVSLVLVGLSLVAALDTSPDWTLLFEGPGQLVALAVGGIFTLSIEVLSVTLNVSLIWLPLVVTAAVIAALLFLSTRDERATPSASRTVRSVRSAITGLVLSLLILLIAAILPIRYSFGGGGDDYFASLMSGGIDGSAVSFTAFLGALLVGTGVSFLARSRVSAARAARVATPLRQAVTTVWRTLALYLGAVASLITVGLIVYFAVEDASTLLGLLLWLPTLVLLGLGFVNLAPVGVFGGSEALAGLGTTQTSYWMPADLPVWATAVIVLLNLALLVATGLVLALRRTHGAVSTGVRWMTTVASFAVAGAIIALLSGIPVWSSLDTGSSGGLLDGMLGQDSGIAEAVSVRAVIGLAAWTFIIFAVVGALVEAVATYLAPLLVPFVPASVRSRITGSSASTSPASTPASTSAPTPGVATPAETNDTSVLAAVAPVVAADGSTPDWSTAPASSTDPTSLTDETPYPNPTPMTPERKKKLAIIFGSIGAALVLIVGAAVAFSVVNSTIYNPEHQVESYLDALVDGDGTAALEAGDPNLGEISRALLTDEVLGAAESRVTGYTITDSNIVGDTASVRVDIEQGDETTAAYYDVVRSGKTFVVFDTWELSSVDVETISMRIPAEVTELLVNKVPVSLEGIDTSVGFVDFAAFPGEYTVEVGGSNEYLASEPATTFVSAGLGIVEIVSLELAPTEAFHDAVSTQIDAYLEACISQGELQPEGCPMYTFAYGDITDVKWTITTPATFTVEGYGDGDWYVISEDYGTATVSYTRTTSFSPAEAQTDERDFRVSGMVTMVDGEPVYSSEY